jgi:hypothetical protein
MCEFVGKCVDLDKLTDEEIQCLERFLQDRQANLQALLTYLQKQTDADGRALLDDSRERVNRVDEAFRKIAPRHRT